MLNVFLIDTAVDVHFDTGNGGEQALKQWPWPIKDWTKDCQFAALAAIISVLSVQSPRPFTVAQCSAHTFLLLL